MAVPNERLADGRAGGLPDDAECLQPLDSTPTIRRPMKDAGRC